MPSTQNIIISTFTGILNGAGWWIFADGVVTSPDAFPWYHLAPALAIVFAMLMINLVPPSRIEESAVKLWLFAWFTVAMTCVGIAIWITAVEYPAEFNWPGVTLILQTVLVLCGGTLFFIGRKNSDPYSVS